MTTRRRRGDARNWLTAEDVASDKLFIDRLPGTRLYLDSTTCCHTGLRDQFGGTGTHVGLHADTEVIVEKLDGNHLFFIDPSRKSGRSTGRTVVLWIGPDGPVWFEVVSQQPATKRPRMASPPGTALPRRPRGLAALRSSTPALT